MIKVSVSKIYNNVTFGWSAVTIGTTDLLPNNQVEVRTFSRYGHIYTKIICDRVHNEDIYHVLGSDCDYVFRDHGKRRATEKTVAACHAEALANLAPAIEYAQDFYKKLAAE